MADLLRLLQMLQSQGGMPPKSDFPAPLHPRIMEQRNLLQGDPYAEQIFQQAYGGQDSGPEAPTYEQSRHPGIEGVTGAVGDYLDQSNFRPRNFGEGLAAGFLKGGVGAFNEGAAKREAGNAEKKAAYKAEQKAAFERRMQAQKDYGDLAMKKAGQAPDGPGIERTAMVDIPGVGKVPATSEVGQEWLYSTGKLKRPPRAPNALDARNSERVSMSEDIANEIIEGRQPPTFENMRDMTGPVRAVLARKGYNLALAQQDFYATRRHLAALNSTQQNRMRQAAQTAYDSLDIIDQLSDEWSALGKRSKLPDLNWVTMEAAKRGAFGEEATSVANRLDLQISDVVSEMANVYMGGNSPTDKGLQLAEKNLKGKWSQKVLKDATNLSRVNLKVRLNSMDNAQAVTLSGDQAVGAREPQPMEHVAPTTAAPTGPQPVPDGKVRIKLPNGAIGLWPKGKALPSGAKEVR